MKHAHFIEMRVFSKEIDDEGAILNKISDIFPLDLEKEKISIGKQSAEVFDNKKINILKVSIKKDRHIGNFLDRMFSRLTKDQKELLLKQIESRLDNDLNFFFRLDKEKLMDGEYWITDSGNCFHFKISVAAYPHKREVAKKIIEDLLIHKE